MRKRFRSMLAELSSLPVDRQEAELRTRLEAWKTRLAKTMDDILVCGVRIRLG